MRSRFLILTPILAVAFSTTASAVPPGKSDLPGRRVIYGLKWPNSPAEGRAPVESYAEVATTGLKGYNELLPYVLASPDQEDAGSCLYMSLTGIAEWWLARLHPELSRAHDGPLDLSERYMMNISGIDEAANGVPNWKTDSIWLYNEVGHGILNSAYRFTKGWYVLDHEGNPVVSTATVTGASFDTTFNWIDQRGLIPAAAHIALPNFDREVIYADPESNQWNTAVMPADIVERVKTKLQARQAPVNVIYNHFGYWHSVMVLGFDDSMSSNGCGFVERFDGYMPSEAARLRDEAAKTSDPEEKKALLARATKLETLGAKFHQAYTTGGGCSGRGMLYVRDSIYPDDSDPYDFTPGQTGGGGHYSKKIVLREYEWLRYMANHATQVFVKP